MSDFSRRSFLRGSAALGAAGALGSLFPWLSARAAGDRIPRLVLFYTPHGTVWNRWRPTGTESSFAFSPILAPLEGFRDRLVVLDGLRMNNPYDHRVPHTYDFPALWSGSPIDLDSEWFRRPDHGVTFGWNLGTTVDQALAARRDPAITPFPTVELGIGCVGAHPATRMIYSGPYKPKHPVDDPVAAYTHLFSSLSETAGERARRKSVLDAVRGELATVQSGLSASDRARLDAHATALREVEYSLSGGVECDDPDQPSGGGLDVAVDQQLDLMAAALGCRLTDVISFQHRVADNDGSLYPWVGIESGGHHSTSHDTSEAAQDRLAELYTWYSRRFARLLAALDAIPDGDGYSVLDNSLVIWGTEISQGWNHGLDNIPFVVAGGACGRMQGNRWLQPSGMAHNRLLVSACHYMGFDEVETYGMTDTGSGGVPGLIV